MKVAEKLGVTAKEIDKLCDAVLAASKRARSTRKRLREATGKASRNLGEEGRKKGLTTTLPVALEKLQASGDIRRIPMNGRSISSATIRAVASESVCAASSSHGEAFTELARRYFAWIGPASAGRIPVVLRDWA